MIEITNRQKGPVQLVIKSKEGGFTCKNIPGMGAGKNVIYLEDELTTDTVEQIKNDGLISTRYVKNTIEGE